AFLQVKCDQRTPTCARCADRGLHCPGYVLNLRWAPQNQLQAQSSTISDAHHDHPRPVNSGRAQNQAGALDPNLNTHMSTGSWYSDSTPSQTHASPTSELPYPLGHWNFTTPLDSFFTQPSYSPFFGEQMISLLPTTPTAFSAMSSTPFEDLIWDNLQEQPLTETDRQQAHQDQNCSMEPPGVQVTRPLVNLETEPRGEPSLESTSAVTRFTEIVDTPSILSDYFFKEVISLYSVWDGQMNSLRVLTASMWQSSGILYHTMQSMAAACLTRTFPEMHAVATRERQLGLQCLKSGKDEDEDKMLGAILLGHTASWVNPHDLAHENFDNALVMLHTWASNTRDHSRLSFFGGAFDYWAMLLSFVSETRLDRNYLRHSITEAGPPNAHESTTPHSFIGTSGKIVQILTDVGMLIFKHRKRVSEIDFFCEEDLDYFQNSIRKARQLERRLLAFKPLIPTNIYDPGDLNTRPLHFVKIDEALHCTGLLQLYRVFPDLLNDRYQPLDRNTLLQPQPTLKKPSQEERSMWLTNLGLYIVEILRDIPFESRTRCMQPFMLVAVSCELRMPSDIVQGYREGGNACNAIEMAQARDFLRSRMSAYMHAFPLRKIEKVFELITHIWSAMDREEKDVYWLDVCKRMRLGTLMG
ncbi:fungal-specific transcription factor domain-containing protein, partial [Ilyonectria destructans]